MISNKTTVKIIVCAWFMITACYLMHTPCGVRNHDFNGHVKYTEIIAKEHRFPKPYEGWETFHNPLYYFLNSFVFPDSFNSGKALHVYCVRCLSIFYGLVALLIMYWFLLHVNILNIYRLLVLLYIATTPTFVYIFTTYNNDSLAAVFSFGVLAITFKSYKKWSLKGAISLFLLSAGAFYSKFSTLLLFIFLITVLSKNIIFFKLPNNLQLKLIGILLLSMLSLFPWLYFHNYKHTGKLLPTNFERGQTKVGISELKTVLGIVLRTPSLQMYKIDYSHEWDEPWAYPEWVHVTSGKVSPMTKRYDFLGCNFISSVIEEYKYVRPSVNVIWCLLLIHLLAYLISLRSILHSNLTKLAGFMIFFVFLEVITVVMPSITLLPRPVTDYRFIIWTVAGWSVLYATQMSKSYNDFFSWIFKFLLILGTILNIYVLLTVKTA